MFKYFTILFCSVLIISCEYESFELEKDLQTPLASCVDGVAKIPGTDLEFSCLNYDLVGHVSLDIMDAEYGNDCWGWTDNSTGKEYAIMGLTNGTAFIDISDPVNPIYLGKLPTATTESSWRDMKVYKNYLYVVSEANDHGLQIFDLTKLRVVDSLTVFSPDFIFNEFGQAHNIAINEDSGYAYIAGSCYQNSCKQDRSGSKGLYVLDLSNPLNPEAVIELPDFGYSHDIQVVNYKGPDINFFGEEIYIGSNENRVVFVNVSDKNNPVLISEFEYPEEVTNTEQYTHQAWLTKDQKYLFLGDEYDELQEGCIESKGQNCDLVDNTKTYVVDVEDLKHPKLHYIYKSNLEGIDHNGYVNNTEFYLASYTNGLRVIDILNINQKNIFEIGFFDTYFEKEHSGAFNKVGQAKLLDPGGHDGRKGENIEYFNGAWSTYPFFKSENILISDINSGLFIVKKQN